MSDGILTQGKLFPARDFSQHEVVNRFALDGTGLNGLFVSYNTGSQNPDILYGYNGQAVGTPYTNTFTQRGANPRRVRPAAAGDLKWQVAGVTLNTVAINEENGLPIILLPKQVRDERQFTPTGQTVPLVKRGFITISNSMILGPLPPLAGYPFVATGVGQITALTPAFAASNTGFTNLVLGRFTSSTGINNGGYTELEVNL